MRGRHNHGKRQALFDRQRRRYLRRLHRYLRSGKKQQARHGFVPPVGGHKPKWVMRNYPFKQTKLREKIKRPFAWPMFPLPVWLTVTRTNGGYKSPPHWHAHPRLHHDFAGDGRNPPFALIGKQRRVVMALGHKNARLTGIDRQRAWARLFYFKNGMMGYPAWDPDHRMPVFP